MYSTYLKIKSKGEDRVKDRVGIRILTESIADCYNILGLLHAKYKYYQKNLTIIFLILNQTAIDLYKQP